jgi:cytochrome c6
MNNGRIYSTLLVVGACCLSLFSATGDIARAATAKTGEAGFKEHCAACHADGGNSIKQAKTLSKKDREKNGVFTEKDIINAMRKPGLWCLKTFDKKALPERDAKEIADYIIKTFK